MPQISNVLRPSEPFVRGVKMDVLEQIKELLLENHKAHWCPYDGLFCQEGYCEDCEVYQIWKENRSDS